MAKHVLRDAGISVGGIDLSDHVREIELASEQEPIDASRHGGTKTETRLGLYVESLAVRFWLDFAIGEIDSVLAPLFLSSMETPVVVRPGGGGRRYSAPCRLIRYNPIGSELGAGASTEALFVPTGIFVPSVETWTVGSLVEARTVTVSYTQGSLVEQGTV